MEMGWRGCSDYFLGGTNWGGRLAGSVAGWCIE